MRLKSPTENFQGSNNLRDSNRQYQIRLNDNDVSIVNFIDLETKSSYARSSISSFMIMPTICGNPTIRIGKKKRACRKSVVHTYLHLTRRCTYCITARKIYEDAKCARTLLRVDELYCFQFFYDLHFKTVPTYVHTSSVHICTLMRRHFIICQ